MALSSAINLCVPWQTAQMQRHRFCLSLRRETVPNHWPTPTPSKVPLILYSKIPKTSGEQNESKKAKPHKTDTLDLLLSKGKHLNKKLFSNSICESFKGVLAQYVQ